MCHGTVICNCSNAFSATCKVHPIMDFSSISPPPMILWLTPTWIEPVARTHASPHPGSVFLSALIWCHGHPNSNLLSPSLALRQNTAVLQIALPSPVGYVNCYTSSSTLHGVPLWYIVTTSVRLTSPATPSSINEPNTLRSTYTLFKIVSRLAKHACCMSLQAPSLLIYSLKGSLTGVP